MLDEVPDAHCSGCIYDALTFHIKRLKGKA